MNTFLSNLLGSGTDLACQHHISEPYLFLRLRFLSQNGAIRRLSLIEKDWEARILFAHVKLLRTCGAGFDAGRIAATEVTFQDLASRRDIDRIERAGWHTLHAL